MLPTFEIYKVDIDITGSSTYLVMQNAKYVIINIFIEHFWYHFVLLANLLDSIFSCINCCFVVLHSNFPAIFIEFLCSHPFLDQQGGIILTDRVQKSPEKWGIFDQSIYRESSNTRTAKTCLIGRFMGPRKNVVICWALWSPNFLSFSLAPE